MHSHGKGNCIVIAIAGFIGTFQTVTPGKEEEESLLRALLGVALLTRVVSCG